MNGEQCDVLCLDEPTAERYRERRLGSEQAERLAADFKALADPTRLVVAATLAETGDICVHDLSWIIERPENLVSHHVRHLHSAGLVTRRRDGKMIHYELNRRGRELVELALAPTEVPA